MTGGLPFFGGPGNNRSMRAIATMVSLLRARPGGYGLVTANGGLLSRHATGIYSTTPFSGKWMRPNPAAGQCLRIRLSHVAGKMIGNRKRA